VRRVYSPFVLLLKVIVDIILKIAPLYFPWPLTSDMNDSSLQTHYDKKYAHETDVLEVTPIDVVDAPSNRFEAAVKFIPQFVPGGSILELGAGNGAVAKTLLNSGMDIESYTMGDISLPRVAGIARSIQDDRVSVLHMDVDRMPEPDAKYDAVVMIALIEHLIDPLRAMQNIHKVLKPGGIAYIDTPNIAKYTRRIKLMLGQFPSTASNNEGLTTYYGEPVDLHDEGHLHYFTYGSLSNLLIQRCGFTEVKKLSYRPEKRLLGKSVDSMLARLWPEAFSGEVVVIARA
jgi:SAM-dependent methyltransferase